MFTNTLNTCFFMNWLFLLFYSHVLLEIHPKEQQKTSQWNHKPKNQSDHSLLSQRLSFSSPHSLYKVCITKKPTVHTLIIAELTVTFTKYLQWCPNYSCSLTFSPCCTVKAQSCWPVTGCAVDTERDLLFFFPSLNLLIFFFPPMYFT